VKLYEECTRGGLVCGTRYWYIFDIPIPGIGILGMRTLKKLKETSRLRKPGKLTLSTESPHTKFPNS
jgi:hypothetical protein